jgi:hypothetical protein
MITTSKIAIRHVYTDQIVIADKDMIERRKLDLFFTHKERGETGLQMVFQHRKEIK